MKGYHKVKVFEVKNGELTLPEGWKPFAVLATTYGIHVVCRYWHRVEE